MYYEDMKLAVANWKENPKTVEEAVGLAQAEDIEGAIVCPPFPFLETVGKVLKRATLGAQDLSHNEGGAHTGEVSAAQLAALGVRYVIVGHSERREAEDTDEIVARKFDAALRAGLMPILCVGERERESGIENKELSREREFVKKQLGAVFVSNEVPRPVIAYEPVWAISSRSEGVADTPESAGEMIRFVKKTLDSKFKIQDSRVLYGGSVNGSNARAFLALPECDGVLVGGASLRPEEFRRVVAAAGLATNNLQPITHNR